MKCEIDWRSMDTFHGDEGLSFSEPDRWRGHTVTARYCENCIIKELEALGIDSAIIETHHQRGDYTFAGRPRADAKPTSAAVQLWFELNGARICMPSSLYRSWQNNLKAIAMTLTNDRRTRDYGVATMDQQYAGYAELPNASHLTVPYKVEMYAKFLVTASRTSQDWKEVARDHEVLAFVYKEAAKNTHPDVSGQDNQAYMVEVNIARDFIKEYQIQCHTPS